MRFLSCHSTLNYIPITRNLARCRRLLTAIPRQYPLHFTPHDFRHWFVTRYLLHAKAQSIRNGTSYADAKATFSRVMAWTNPHTIETYDHSLDQVEGWGAVATFQCEIAHPRAVDKSVIESDALPPPLAAMSLPLLSGNELAEEGLTTEELDRKPYLFQSATDETGRLGSLQIDDVTTLLRFMLHGIQFTTRDGSSIQFATHLIRHVVATYVRHEAAVPPAAIAAMFHHETMSSTMLPTPIPAATDYYSKMPVEDALMNILALAFVLTNSEVSVIQKSTENNTKWC